MYLYSSASWDFASEYEARTPREHHVLRLNINWTDKMIILILQEEATWVTGTANWMVSLIWTAYSISGACEKIMYCVRHNVIRLSDQNEIHVLYLYAYGKASRNIASVRFGNAKASVMIRKSQNRRPRLMKTPKMLNRRYQNVKFLRSFRTMTRFNTM